MTESVQFGVENALMIAAAIDSNDLRHDLLVMSAELKTSKPGKLFGNTPAALMHLAIGLLCDIGFCIAGPRYPGGS